MIDNILKYLQAFVFKYLLKPLLIFGLFILFREPLERIMNNFFVDTFFQYINRGYSKDFVLLLFLILILRLKLKRKLGDFRFLFPTFFSFLFIYLFYRFGWSTKWQIEPLCVLPTFTYFDSLFLILFLILIPFPSKMESTKTKTLFEDLPLYDENNRESIDHLGYSAYAKQISKKIDENIFKKAFAIGINGKWGSGKSSFINLMAEELKESDFIKMNFNPWASKNPEAITQDFFEELEDTLIENDYLIGNLISSYSNKILNNTSNNWIKALISFFSNKVSFSSTHQRLEKTLSKLDKRIVVIIDDVDRLETAEMMEVFKIIRNTANFPNLVYLVAYDKNYIAHKLDFEKNGINNNYLEKIFQLEISLPYFDKLSLYKKLVANITEILNQINTTKAKDLIEKIEDDRLVLVPYSLPLIDNLRDITRLSNTLSMNLTGEFLNETNLEEFLCLELLRIKELDIYEKIKIKDESLLLMNNQRISLKHILPYNFQKQVNSGENKRNETLIALSDYLKSKYSAEFERNLKAEEIEGLLTFIFGNLNEVLNGNLYEDHNAALSIRRPSRFQIYFYYYLPINKLPIFELTNLREENDFDLFDKLIKSKVGEGIEDEIKDYFLRINDFNNHDDFKGIIQSIQKFAKQFSRKGNLKNETLISFDFENLYAKITGGYLRFIQNNDSSVEEYFKIEDREDFQKFILKILSLPVPFNQINQTCLFESNFIYWLKKKYEHEEAILFKEKYSILLDINIEILKNYCSNLSSIDQVSIQLYRNTNVSNIPKGEKYDEKASSIIKELALKNLKPFFESSIGIVGRENELAGINKFIINIFDFQWDLFERFIIENKFDQPFYNEYLNLFGQFKANDYKNIENFKFNYLKPKMLQY